MKSTKRNVLASISIAIILSMVFGGCIQNNSNEFQNDIHETIIIQNLINNASPGDTLQIPNGIYYENIIINKSLIVTGENKERSIIHGNGDDNVVKIIADNVTFKGFTLENSGNISKYANYCGIHINSTNCTIADNIAQDNQQGIKIIGKIIWAIQDNGNPIGIPLNQHHNIYNNILRNNSEGFVIAGDGLNNSFFSNDIYENGKGVVLYTLEGYNRVFDNFIYKNRIGIHLIFGRNNLIYNNSIFNNSRFGIEIPEIQSDDNINNKIYFNNFISNEQNAFSRIGNIWFDNITKQGNYWDDYNGTDEDGDDIGDIPYDIGIDIQDLYPLMNPFKP